MNNTNIIITIIILLLISSLLVTKSQKIDNNEIAPNKQIIENMAEDLLKENLLEDLSDDLSEDLTNECDEKTNYVKQFKVGVENMFDKNYYYTNIKQHKLKYPVRITSARNIITGTQNINEFEKQLVMRTINTDTVFSHAKQFYNIDELFDYICSVYKRHFSICRSLNEIDLYLDKGIIVQELPCYKIKTKNAIYVFSCIDGVDYKLYEIDTTSNIWDSVEISMKNIELSNKKHMRNILHNQHKKLKTIYGVFSIGFYSSHPTIKFDDDPFFKYVGITVNLREQKPDLDPGIKLESDIASNRSISYPYKA